jgi:hypothetical protein
VKRWRALGAALAAFAASACTVGEGTGWVRATDALYIEDCWDGPFNLRPDFFGANPYGNQLMIRVQRGDNIEEMSDGLLVVITDLAEVRKHLGADVKVGMPHGVSPPGKPVVEQEDPPKVSLALYLHNSCHAQNATVHSISGSIKFDSLFNGVVNASRAEDRLTSASFKARFADPRLEPEKNPEVVSEVEGAFEFYFERGQPAQPFQ